MLLGSENYRLGFLEEAALVFQGEEGPSCPSPPRHFLSSLLLSVPLRPPSGSRFPAVSGDFAAAAAEVFLHL